MENVMGLWEKFKSGFREATVPVQKDDASRCYEDNSTELKAKYQAVTESSNSDNQLDYNEILRQALEFEEVSLGKQDFAKALQLFIKARDLGSKEADFYLGSLYRHGLGCTKNYDMAIACYTQAINSGIDEAHIYLAYMYIDKHSVSYWSEDANNVIKYFESYINTNLFKLDGKSKLVKEHTALSQYVVIKSYYEYSTDNKMKYNETYINPYKASLIKDYTESYYEYLDTEDDFFIDIYAKYLSGLGVKVKTNTLQKSDDFLDDLSLSKVENPWYEHYELAETYYYGLGEEIQDYKEAIKLYMKAAELGSDDAMLMLGVMYRDAEGCIQDNEKSLDYLKEGAKLGNINCYAEMAKLFAEIDHNENASKCWDKFFSSHDSNNKRNIIQYALHYMLFIRFNDVLYKHRDKLLPYKSEIFARLDVVKAGRLERDGQAGADDVNAFYALLN